MKKAIKFTSLLILTLIMTIYSCSDDDAVIINLENLEVTIDENPATGQVIGTVQSDTNNALTFSIDTQTPSGALSIDENTGELTVADASLFDFETNPVITATVSATGAANTATVTINLNDVIEALPATVGEFRDGGVVFWVDPTDNTKGLVCAITNQNSSMTVAWGCLGSDIGATDTAIGTGATNTATIVANSCSASGTAAKIISDLVLNGYDDWFLPSKDELNEMYLNRDIINTTAGANGGGNFSQGYWSSSEGASDIQAWAHIFDTNLQVDTNRGNLIRIRAVRAF